MIHEIKPAHFSAFAVSLTGNRGAVSMLVSAIDNLIGNNQKAHLTVFTVYPKSDEAVELPLRVALHNGSPSRLAFYLVPLCLLYRVASFFRLSFRRLPRDLQVLTDTDVVLAIGGTTFSDAQLFKVIYNVLCLLPGIILNKPIMLYSQTLGPFENRLNRLLAKWSLNRCSFVAPRGEGSLKSVRSLNLITPCEHFADAAFTLIVPDEIRDKMKNKYAYLEQKRGRIVGISVNSIVWEKATKIGIEHNEIWADFIQKLQHSGYTLLLIPHSLRPGKHSTHNNDLNLIKLIQNLLPNQEVIHVIDEPYNSKELRVLVGLCDYYIASRFHAMISALCEAVPVAVFGWGYHKYWEVMNEFDLSEYCWDASELTVAKLWNAFERVLSDTDVIREKMLANLPKVQALSMKNHQMAWQIYENQLWSAR